MSRFAKAVRRFFSEEDAPSAVEYGVMVALIAVVIFFGARTMGRETRSIFRDVAEVLKEAIDA